MQEPIKDLTHCKACDKNIPSQAKKCHFCASYQSFSWFHFFQSLSSATAFLLVIVSFVSLSQTCSEKHNAKVAANAATQAQKDAETAKKEAVKQAEELVRILEAKTDFALQRIELVSELADLLADASSNYNSLISLEKISLDNNYPYPDLRNRAKEAVRKIKAEIINEANIYSEPAWSWVTDSKNSYFHYFETKDWVFEDFLNKYDSLLDQYKANYIKFVCNRVPKVSKKERFRFLFKVLSTERLPIAIYMACSIIEQEAQLKKDFLSDKSEYLKWLEVKIM